MNEIQADTRMLPVDRETALRWSIDQLKQRIPAVIGSGSNQNLGKDFRVIVDEYWLWPRLEDN